MGERDADSRKENRRWIRYSVQAGFLLFSVLLGLEFARFVSSLAAPPDHPLAPRPGAVEAYLPISSLMSLTYLFKSGEASRVHPAGMIILSLAVLSALLLRRGFCSWVCPIGTLSEYAHKAGRKLLRRNRSLTLWADRILRGIKYALLGFFLLMILPMPQAALREFIQGPYNRIADVKMYLFFAEISATALWVIILLSLLSFVVKNFWCRYLCPYGALLGLLSRLSLVGVQRDPGRCDLCKRCDRTCPNRIQVSEERFVASEECTACFSCIQSCPREGALQFATRGRARVLRENVYAILLLFLFVFLPRLFSALGYWESDTPTLQYRSLYATIHEIDHPRGPAR